MRSIRNSVLFKRLALAIGLLAASVSTAYAQSARGSFTLPHEARWGNVLLSPGVYTFSLQSPSLPAPIMVGKAGSSKRPDAFPRQVSEERLSLGSRMETASFADHDRRRQRSEEHT